MKEAAGEANLTVIAIVLIGIISAIAIPLITNLMNQAKRKACCTEAGGKLNGTQCVDSGNGYYDGNAAYKACLEADEGE